MNPQCFQKYAIVFLLGMFIFSLRWTGYIKDEYKLQINKKLKKIINYGTITSPQTGYEELRLELLQNMKHIDNSGNLAFGAELRVISNCQPQARLKPKRLYIHTKNK